MAVFGVHQAVDSATTGHPRLPIRITGESRIVLVFRWFVHRWCSARSLLKLLDILEAVGIALYQQGKRDDPKGPLKSDTVSVSPTKSILLSNP